MVEVIKIQTNNTEQKKNKSGFFVLLGIFIFYLIAVFTTIAIIGTDKQIEKVGKTGAGGFVGAYYYKEVVFYNLKVGEGSFEIKASDFVIETPKGDYKAICFEGGAKTYTIRRTKKSEYIKVMFSRSDEYSNPFAYEIEYKDEELDFMHNQTLSELLTPILCAETFFFVIIFALTFIVIKNIGASKPFKVKCRELNEGFTRILKEKNFKSTKVFYMSSPRTGETNMEKMILCVDKNNSRLALVDYLNKECVIAGYKDIVKYDVIEKNGVGMKQVTGVTLFDLPYTETETYDLCNKLQLVVILNDENKTNVVYDFVKSGIRTTSNIYKEIHRTLIDVSSTLEIITGGRVTGSDVKGGGALIHCKYCGVKNKADASHCSSCGAVLD